MRKRHGPYNRDGLGKVFLNGHYHRRLSEKEVKQWHEGIEKAMDLAAKRGVQNLNKGVQNGN